MKKTVVFNPFLQKRFYVEMSYFCQALELQIRENDEGSNKVELLQEKENPLYQNMNSGWEVVHLCTRKAKDFWYLLGCGEGAKLYVDLKFSPGKWGLPF